MDYAESRLHACCSSLGFFDEATGTYVKEPDCELTCKELIRSLKREDETRQVRRKIGFLKVFENDLISIICNYPDDHELFDSVIRLMQNLSSPAVLCFGNIPTDAQFRSYYLELERYLRSYKQAFVNDTLIYNIGLRIKTILESDDAEEEEMQLIIERILILFRNILHIDSCSQDENRTDDDASLHDQVIWVMKKTGAEAVLKYLATNEDQSKWCMHVLEILFHMLRDQSPELLASTPSAQISDMQEWQKSQKENEIEAKELCTLLLKEKEQRKVSAAVSSSRHSRFGGSYYVTNLKALNPNNALIYHGAQRKAKYISFDDMKDGKKKPKRLQPVCDRGVPRRSTKTIRQFLKEFVNELLEHSFNNLMHAASDAIKREKIQHNDESYFLWCMGFFLEFNRCYKFRPELIAEVLSAQIFSFIHLKMGEYYEMMLQEKKTQFIAVSWAERMHFALKAFSELLKSCEKMSLHSEKDVTRSADILKRNLFYNSEYRDLFIGFMQKFDHTKMSKSYLKDLIETNHVFLKMLEDFATKKKLIIKKKGKKKKKTQKNDSQKSAGPTKSGSKLAQTDTEKGQVQESDDIEQLWDNIAPSLSAILQKRLTVSEQTMMPFDPLSEIALQDQKQIAMARLQRLLRSVQVCEDIDEYDPTKELVQHTTAAKVIELLRECRKVWSEDDVFGGQDASVEEEFLLLRSIHLAPKIDISQFRQNLGEFKDFEKQHQGLEMVNEEPEDQQLSENDALHEELVDGGLLSDSSSADDEMRELDANEQYFDFQSHLHQYARWDVVRCYSYLLQFFKTNFSQTNKAILKMLHRIACDLSMPGLLFQASLFKIFRDILREASIRTTKQKLSLDSVMKELVVFAKYLIKQFVRAAQKNRDIFMELIFWKDTSVACEIIEGYGTYVKHGRSEDFRMVFTEDNNNELIRLFKLYQDSEQNEAQGGVVEFIMSHFSRELTKPKVVANQLKALGLVTDLNELRMVSGREYAGVWRPEQETELQFLWEQFRSSEDPLTEIYNAMVHKRPRVRIVQKLLMMGLAKTKNEITKPDIWPEHLIEELRSLYETNKDEAEPLRAILDKLSIAKSKNQILNKLVDLNLISNVAEMKAQRMKSGAMRKPGRQSKVWSEEEVQNLKELFSRFRKLKPILENKTFEASRKEVIEKLKELNLDYKSSSGKKGKGLNFLEANEMLGEGDFEEEISRSIAETKKNRPTKSDMSKNLKSNCEKVLRNLNGKIEGCKDAINWLINSLRSSAEVKMDLEDGEDDAESAQLSFPLVPNGNATELALDDENFRRLLRLLGMSDPSGGEEIFWRVPAFCTSDMINFKLKALEESWAKISTEVDNIANTGTDDNGAGSDQEIRDEEESQDHDSDDEESDSESQAAIVRQKHLDMLRKKAEERKRKQISEMAGSDGERTLVDRGETDDSEDDEVPLKKTRISDEGLDDNKLTEIRSSKSQGSVSRLQRVDLANSSSSEEEDNSKLLIGDSLTAVEDQGEEAVQGEENDSDSAKQRKRKRKVAISSSDEDDCV